MIRHALRRPLLSSAAALAVVSATAAGFAATSSSPSSEPQLATYSLPVPAEQLQPRSSGDAVDQVREARVADSLARQSEARKAYEAKVAAAKAKAAAAAKAKAEAEAEARAEAARKAAAERDQTRASRSTERAAISSGDPKGIARSMLGSYGWSSGQFDCLDSLWTKESNWDPNAENPSSGAYGIPQALPGSKMESAGSDWRTNPATQIEWGLGYIKDRYGSPCSAWSHSQANNWY